MQNLAAKLTLIQHSALALVAEVDLEEPLSSPANLKLIEEYLIGMTEWGRVEVAELLREKANLTDETIDELIQLIQE